MNIGNKRFGQKLSIYIIALSISTDAYIIFPISAQNPKKIQTELSVHRTPALQKFSQSRDPGPKASVKRHRTNLLGHTKP